MQGFIMIWSGAVVDIPPGWALCDGNNGTPDLRGCVVGGAGGAWNPDQSISTNIATDSGICIYALSYVMKL